MFLVYNLNIMIYRYDSFLFNYHATIINRKRLRDATIVVQTRVFSFVIKKR
jgi:hypothetical protein